MYYKLYEIVHLNANWALYRNIYPNLLNSPDSKAANWIKPESTLLFHFVYMLKSKVLNKIIFNITE